MKVRPPIHSLILAAGLLGSGLLFAGDMEQNLVARWTFKDGSLKSDVGDFQFEADGRGTLEASDGTVTLNDRKFLVCPQLSSLEQPELQKSVTLWARLKIDELPETGGIGLMGFQEGRVAGSWPSFIFTLLYRALEEEPSQSGLAFLARTGVGEVGVGVRRYQPVTAGEFINVAIVFNGQTNTAGMWVSSTGQWVESKLAGVKELVDFGSFGIGHLMSPGGTAVVTFDEVRVYSTALEPQWLEEISAVKE